MIIDNETITEKKFKSIVNTDYPIKSEDFWQNDSGKVFYMDCDPQTCINALHDELGYDYDDCYDCYTLYYIKDLFEYALVENN